MTPRSATTLRSTLILASLAVMLAAPALALAQVPRFVPYSGRLTDGAVPPRTGKVDLRVDLFNCACPAGGGCSAVGGIECPTNDPDSGLIRSEIHNEAKTVNGYFSLLLGTRDAAGAKVFPAAFPTNLPPRMWLRISVKLENETWKTLPRQEIGSAPYALHAGDGVPPGAVMAFDLEQCPHGWSEHMPARGRTLIGVNPTVENGLSPRALGESTGAEVHVLSEEQMPKHKHTISAYDVVNADFDWADTGLVVEGGKKTGQYAKGYGSTHTSEKGGAPHNNMQPSLALLYCKKL